MSITLILWVQIVSAENTINLKKIEKPEFHETIYSLTGDLCNIEWNLKRFGESPGFGISDRSECMLPIDKQVIYQNQLLKKIIEDTNNLQGMRNLFWGRLQRGNLNDEYAVRLSRAVAKSKHWNSSKGILVKYPQGINRFIIEILNQDKIFSELIDVFSRVGFELMVNDVEKVLVSDNLSQKTGVKGKFPVDCMVTFGVFPKNKPIVQQ